MSPFNHTAWEQSRKERLARVETQEARNRVMKGRVQRICKPGFWRVFKDGDRVVTEVFG